MNGIFFFSIRRRHTRYIGDWSSDVCSSDLSSSRSHLCISSSSGWCISEATRPRRVAPNIQHPSPLAALRSEERRVGEECSTRRPRYQRQEKGNRKDVNAQTKKTGIA